MTLRSMFAFNTRLLPRPGDRIPGSGGERAFQRLLVSRPGGRAAAWLRQHRLHCAHLRPRGHTRTDCLSAPALRAFLACGRLDGARDAVDSKAGQRQCGQPQTEHGNPCADVRCVECVHHDDGDAPLFLIIAWLAAFAGLAVQLAGSCSQAAVRWLRDRTDSDRVRRVVVRKTAVIFVATRHNK